VFKSFESNLAFIIEPESKAMIKYHDLHKKLSSGEEEADVPISEHMRLRLYSLDPSDYKEQLKEFFYPISDAVLDYSNILELTKESNQAVTAIENLQFWMFEYHPTHIYQAIYHPMYHYGASSVDGKDIANLTKFCDAIDHILDLASFDTRSQVPEYDSYSKSKEFDIIRKFQLFLSDHLFYS
jgi:hypothetical protein